MLLLTGVLLVFISNIILGIFVLINNPRNISNRYFALMCIGLSSWSIFNYLADFNLDNSLLWSRLSFLAIILSLAFLLMFLNNFPIRVIKTKLVDLLTLIAAIIIGIVSLLPNFITGVEIKNQVSNVKTGDLYNLFLVYFVAAIVISIVIIIFSFKRSSKKDRPRVVFLISGILIMTVLASITNLILPLITGNNYYAKFGSLFTLFFVALTAYAIIKHSLFDIRAVVVRSFAYIFSIMTIAIVYAFIAFGVLGRFIFSSGNVQVPLQQQFANTALAVALAFSFQPIRRFFERVSNRIFYRDRYDAQAVVDDIGRVMASEIKINLLCNKVASEIMNKLNISSADIVVLQKNELIYFTKNIKAKLNENEIKDIYELGNRTIYIDDTNSSSKIKLMRSLNISLCIPLRTKNSFLGYLILTEKQSGSTYNSQDIKTIKIISNELSVALENAKAFMEIQNFNETLQDRINKATKSLQKANAQLKELDEAKDEFISMASHQLRTPLTTVKGYVSMLDEGDFGKLTNEQKQSVDLALDGSNRMARLIDDLLNVSRMEAGKFYIEPTKVDLIKLVQEEINLLQTMAKSKKVSLSAKLHINKLHALNLDENKTRQVVMNLIDNAIHYSEPPKGGGRVEVSLAEKESEVVFKVIDNGIGVPKDQQSKLFTKMFRARNAKEIRPDGTGLGLFLVKRVVEDQGGRLIFESKPGKGSVFGFAMPIHNKIKIDNTAKRKLNKGSSK